MPSKRILKQYALSASKVRRVRKYLRAKTEEEAVERALDLILDNEKMDRAHREWLRHAAEGGELVDILGRVDR